MTAKFRKGDLVRLNTAKCFTKENGGERKHPVDNYHYDNAGVIRADRPTTEEEREAWREERRKMTAELSSAIDAKLGARPSHAFDSAGEPRLPPRSRTVDIWRGRIYAVLRARARVSLGYGNPIGGLTKILCTVTGEEAYVKRDLLEKVE